MKSRYELRLSGWLRYFLAHHMSSFNIPTKTSGDDVKGWGDQGGREEDRAQIDVFK